MRRLVLVFLALVARFLLLELAYLPRGEILGFHHFRQSHTAMMAWNFAFHDGNLLRPTIDGITWGKDLYPNEFPLYPWLVGMLWRLTGPLSPERAAARTSGKCAATKARFRRRTSHTTTGIAGGVVLGLSHSH